MRITKRIALEIIEHEGVVREAYYDSVRVLTWSVGITHFSGHTVQRYIRNPQSLERCFEVFEWALRTNFLPAVAREFEGYPLEEHQLGAALSFHWNTGGINRASWCDAWKAGDIADARRRFMLWDKPKEIIPRRRKEMELFFDGKWTSDGVVTEFPVNRSTLTPIFSRGKQVKVDEILDRLFDETAEPPADDMVEMSIRRTTASDLLAALNAIEERAPQ